MTDDFVNNFPLCLLFVYIIDSFGAWPQLTVVHQAFRTATIIIVVLPVKHAGAINIVISQPGWRRRLLEGRAQAPYRVSRRVKGSHPTTIYGLPTQCVLPRLGRAAFYYWDGMRWAPVVHWTREGGYPSGARVSVRCCMQDASTLAN